MVMGDFQTVKKELPKSWQASSNGKIYWCVDFTGHKLSLVDGKLLVDGVRADLLLVRLIEEG
jgi:hypothetical protein